MSASQSRARPDRAASVVDQDAGAASLGPGLVPGVLVTGVGEGLAVAAQPLPVAVGELDVQLGVGPHAELVDGGLLKRPEPGPGEVDRGAQDRERHGQDYLVEGDRTGPGSLLEGQGDRAAALAHGNQLLAKLDLPLELGGEPGGELVAAAPDGVLLVGRAEDAQLPLAGEAEQASLGLKVDLDRRGRSVGGPSDRPESSVTHKQGRDDGRHASTASGPRIREWPCPRCCGAGQDTAMPHVSGSGPTGQALCWRSTWWSRWAPGATPQIRLGRSWVAVSGGRSRSPTVPTGPMPPSHWRSCCPGALLRPASWLMIWR